MEQDKIGRFISEMRKKQGMTQEELAVKLSVSQKSVSRWETGKNMPELSLLQPLCDELGISIAELFRGEKIVDNIITSEEITEITTDIIKYPRSFWRRQETITAVTVMVFSLVLVLIIEMFTFSITGVSSSGLETALFEQIHREVTVLQTEPKDSYLFVVYGQTGHPDAGGLACFQKGFLGRYRFVFAHNYNVPLVWAEITQPQIGHYLVSFAFDSKGGSLILGCTLQEKKTEKENVIYFQCHGKPFLQVVKLKKNESWYKKAYYDFEMNETEPDEAWYEIHSDQTAAMMSIDTAELYMVRFIQGVVVTLGLVISLSTTPKRRSFLQNDRSGNKKT